MHLRSEYKGLVELVTALRIGRFEDGKEASMFDDPSQRKSREVHRDEGEEEFPIKRSNTELLLPSINTLLVHRPAELLPLCSSPGFFSWVSVGF